MGSGDQYVIGSLLRDYIPKAMGCVDRTCRADPSWNFYLEIKRIYDILVDHNKLTTTLRLEREEALKLGIQWLI